MARDVFTIPEILNALQEITDEEENKYSDIPGWTGGVDSWTGKAVLLDTDTRWYPLSQLRISGDRQSIYASNWILKQNGH